MALSFLGSAFTVELYWVWHVGELPARADAGDALSRMFRVYGAVDPSFFQAPTAFTRGIELVNVLFTQILNVWLVFAVVKARPYRHALQLAVGAYVAYSVVLYFLVGHLSGFPPVKDASSMALFYAPNLPWLLAHLWFVLHSARAITARFRTSAPTV